MEYIHSEIISILIIIFLFNLYEMLINVYILRIMGF